MKTLLFALLPFLSGASAPALPPLRMTSPDSATAIYADKCSNGKNHDQVNRDKFVQQMLANPKSHLAMLKATLQKHLEDPRGEGVYLGEFVETYNDRDGCGSSAQSYSAMLVTITGGNTDHTVTRYLVTIDDNDDTGVRKLSLRSLLPISIRDGQ